jgi:hypothetical protein
MHHHITLYLALAALGLAGTIGTIVHRYRHRGAP